jgi:hypothetical protein
VPIPRSAPHPLSRTASRAIASPCAKTHVYVSVRGTDDGILLRRRIGQVLYHNHSTTMIQASCVSPHCLFPNGGPPHVKRTTQALQQQWILNFPRHSFSLIQGSCIRRCCQMHAPYPARAAVNTGSIDRRIYRARHDWLAGYQCPVKSHIANYSGHSNARGTTWPPAAGWRSAQ